MEDQKLTYGQKAVGITDPSNDDELSQSQLSFASEIDRLYHIQKNSKSLSFQEVECKKAIKLVKQAARASKKAITCTK